MNHKFPVLFDQFFAGAVPIPSQKKISFVKKELLSYPTLNYIGLVYYRHYKHYKIIPQRRVLFLGAETTDALSPIIAPDVSLKLE